ncbi:hypothetical protein [Turicimonas muris]
MRGIATPSNFSPLFSRLIANNLATLQELQTTMTLEEAYQLDEVLLVENYNKWLAQKSQN